MFASKQLHRSRGTALSFEQLEDRRILATVSVANLYDVVNGNVTDIPTLIGSPGLDGISLREALQAANNTPLQDEILFDPAVFGTPQTINIGSVLNATDSVIIDTEGQDVTIDAGGNSTVLDVSLSTGEVGLILGLTLTGGDSTNPAQAGGLHFSGEGSLTVRDSVITSNQANGFTGANPIF